MSISKKKLLVNGTKTPKAHGKNTGTKNITSIKEIEREMTSAQPVILSGKDKNNFKELSESIKKSFCPQNEFEHALVEQIACFMWKLERLEEIVDKLYEEYSDTDGEIQWSDLLKTNYLKKMVRFESDINNSILKLVYRFKERPVLAMSKQQK